MSGLRILITVETLATRSGSELYVRDLATGLLHRGHTPIVYTPDPGEVANELRALTIPVIQSFDAMGAPPDLVHGNQALETIAALLWFPATPAIYVFHDNLARNAVPPAFPRILRYVAVDYTCRDRLIFEHGVPEARVRVAFNSVDLDRFRPREALPPRPRRALVFSNYAVDNHLDAIRTACRQAGLALDVVGASSGNATARPETILGRYDVVFAKARCALEALAIGAAVVLCDYRGAGPMVTTAELDRLRALNFGHRTLQYPLRPDVIHRELARYDPMDAAEVSRRIRAVTALADAVEELIDLYRDVLAEHQAGPGRDPEAEARVAAAYLGWLSGQIRREQRLLLGSPTVRIRNWIVRLPLVGRWVRAVVAAALRRRRSR